MGVGCVQYLRHVMSRGIGCSPLFGNTRTGLISLGCWIPVFTEMTERENEMTEREKGNGREME